MTSRPDHDPTDDLLGGPETEGRQGADGGAGGLAAAAGADGGRRSGAEDASESTGSAKVVKEREAAGFPMTQWTLIVAVSTDPGARLRALEALCTRYWQPVYAFVRRRGFSPEDSEDLTQDFFASLMERDDFGALSADNGRFRSFVLKALQHFLSNERDRRNAAKRGGGAVHVSIDRERCEEWFARDGALVRDADSVFERRWAGEVIERALALLEETYRSEGKEALFEALAPQISDVGNRGWLEEIGEALDMSPGSVRVALHRMRKRMQNSLRAEIAKTVVDPRDVDAEVRHLLGVFSGS